MDALPSNQLRISEGIEHAVSELYTYPQLSDAAQCYAALSFFLG